MLTPEDLKKLKSNNISSLFGIAIIMTLTTGFSLLFGFDYTFSSRDIAGQIFSIAPFDTGVGFSCFLGREMCLTRKDIAGRYKLLKSGIVMHKYTRINRRNKNSSSSISDRIRHFMVVDGEKLYI